MSRFSQLDGLRGWAALCVAIGHVTPSISPFDIWIIKIFTDTKLAIAVFFVLSGFVLSIKFINLDLDLASFVKRIAGRYFRLMIPIMFISLLVLILDSFSLFYNQKIHIFEPFWGYSNVYNFEKSIIDQITWAFYSVFFNYSNQSSYIPPAWTMPAELRGSYAIYIGLFIIGLFNQKYRIYVLILASGVVSSYLFISDFHYLAYFFVGHILAALYFKAIHLQKSIKQLKEIVFSCLFFLIILFTAFRNEIANVYTDLFLSSMMVACVIWSPFLANFFQNKISRFLGKISFTLYLIHVPIYCSFSSYLLFYFDTHNIVSSTLVFSILIPLSIMLSIFGAYILYPLEKFAIIFNRKIVQFDLKRLKFIFPIKLK